MPTQELLREQQPGTFETISPEALAFMETEGYALIKGGVPLEECAAAVKSMDDDLFSDVSPQKESIEGREQYFAYINPSAEIDVIQDRVVTAVVKSGGREGNYAVWAEQPEEGARPVYKDIFKYSDGKNFAKHVDSGEGEDDFGTQALVTLQGSADFLVFEAIEDEAPKARLKVETGDIVLLRGDEYEGRQLPHAVENIKGQRILMSIYANQGYHQDVASNRGKRLAKEALQRPQTPQVERLASAAGKTLLRS